MFEHKVLDPMTDEEMSVYIGLDSAIDILKSRIESNRLTGGDPKLDMTLRHQLDSLLNLRADAFAVHIVEHVHVVSAEKLEEAKRYLAAYENGWLVPPYPKN